MSETPMDGWSPSSPMKQWAELCPRQRALRTQDQDYAWADLAREVDAIAAGLSEQGLKRGDILTCIGKNTLGGVLIYLACIELGVACALTMPLPSLELERKLSALYPPNQIRNIWTQSDCSLPNTRRFRIDGNASLTKASLYRPDNLASIIFTSGSTGQPKAVVHTHRQHLASASGLLASFPFQQGDSWLLSLPMYHVSGLAILYRWLYCGATLTMASGNLENDLADVTHASLVATQLNRFVSDRSGLKLRQVLLGGSRIPMSCGVGLARQGIRVWLGYGMTEAASTVTAKPIDGIDSSGSLLLNRQVKVERGRVFVGGETLASGYYQQGQIRPLTQDGWFDTGDLGKWVGDELKIIGRADNMFISGGENIHCEEIETVLDTLPEVTASIVVPIINTQFGHRPVAVIASQSELDITEIEASLSATLAKFKWPDAYYKMPAFLSPSDGKISRHAVKEWLDTADNKVALFPLVQLGLS
ncbi:o-succinylbenzoate--CoA ligase [Vibrio ostreicida]|uniref:o-succinylbenzoate--CoA ligase n=1 Tax=Vibrio ostreicida TaxID=526588 RepID=UPI003B5CB065